MTLLKYLLFSLWAISLFACTANPIPISSQPIAINIQPKIALVLGGGAARGFAHIGVIKALEAQGISPDIIVGTSVGSVVGALYAGGNNGFDLQKLALQFEESIVEDWIMPSRGFIKGESLQDFVNKTLQNRPIEKLNKKLAVVAADLQSGEAIIFEMGNTGMAVRASSSVPGIFQPMRINGREYVDGGLVSPVPVRIARKLGADIVIAVDISNKPQGASTKDLFDVLLQTFSIMSQSIARYELNEADVVIRPNISGLSWSNLQTRHIAIIEGERAAAIAMPEIRDKLSRWKPTP